MPKSAAINHVGNRQEGDDAAPALDLVHLSRQTLGDQALETELLKLFDSQNAQFAARLRAPRQPGDARARADLAHTLKGSARAVGAFALGEAAEAYEEALRRGDERSAALCEWLVAEIERAHREIGALLDNAER
ncbi:Hpt domain-containing protein [Methylocystis iwaonis]|uniref:Hpt domain-containing protein n=1 Tax=Methylocystis iwaonis TaxID=2885079 RepID=UPI002E7BF61C|nr:Hpt domain-containing protein [Methylocystis iwaonis]